MKVRLKEERRSEECEREEASRKIIGTSHRVCGVVPPRRRAIAVRSNSDGLKAARRRQKNAYPSMLLLCSRGFKKQTNKKTYPLLKRPERIIQLWPRHKLVSTAVSNPRRQFPPTSHPNQGASTNQQRPVWLYHNGGGEGYWRLVPREQRCAMSCSVQEGPLC